MQMFTLNLVRMLPCLHSGVTDMEDASSAMSAVYFSVPHAGQEYATLGKNVAVHLLAIARTPEAGIAVFAAEPSEVNLRLHRVCGVCVGALQHVGHKPHGPPSGSWGPHCAW